MSDDDLTAEELAFVPADSQFELSVLVQAVDHVDVVVQINSAVPDEQPDATDIRSVEQAPADAQRLAEDLRWHLDGQDLDPALEIRFAGQPVPVGSGEVVHVGVEVDGVRLLVHVR